MRTTKQTFVRSGAVLSRPAPCQG